MIAATDALVVDPHLIGLARVSTDSQDTQLQWDALTPGRLRADLRGDHLHP